MCTVCTSFQNVVAAVVQSLEKKLPGLPAVKDLGFPPDVLLCTMSFSGMFSGNSGRHTILFSWSRGWERTTNVQRLKEPDALVRTVRSNRSKHAANQTIPCTIGESIHFKQHQQDHQTNKDVQQW